MIRLQARQVWRLARKYLFIRYKNTAFGILWSFVNPLLLLLVFSIIFSQAFPSVENYKLFALSGIVIWNFFPGAMGTLIQILPDNAPVLRSYPVAPLVLPLAAILSSLLHFFILFLAFAFLLPAFGWKPSWTLLGIVPGMTLFALFTLGWGLVLGTLNVFFRDVALLWNTLLPAIFYFTPVVFPADLVPQGLQPFLWANPLAWYVLPLRRCLVENEWPTFAEWGVMAILAMTFLFAGLLFFRKLKKYFIAFL
ncbi:MAG: ABC transporter permease [Flavobacteriales bacterium]|nr:ABC transporter permease [Flavobacteriales bacterium]MCX7768494.1 ABC transporter permease [Flavobacteriales bacterium]MDW8409827.1 ABC transporter permease [Flavobacteriales bacterium]